MFCALSTRPRARRELYRVSQADLGEFRLGPRPGRLGLLAFRARRRIGGTAGGPAVRPLRASRGLFAWTDPAGRGVPGCRACTIPLAVPIEPRPLRWSRYRIYRQRSELHPAGPLVWPAIADRDGDRLFRDRRGRLDTAAGIANPDRTFRLAWRLFSTGSPHLARSPTGDFADEGWTLLSAMRHHAFWALFSTFFFTAIGMYAIAPQVVAYLIDAGFPPLQAATAWGFSGVVLLFGMLGISWLDTIIGRRPSVLFSYGVSIAGIIMLWLLQWYPNFWLLTGFVVCFGSMIGSRGPLLTATAMKIFRGRRIGTIYGMITIGSGLGSALGSWSGGLIHDLSHSYNPLILFSLVSVLLGMIPFLVVPALRN